MRLFALLVVLAGLVGCGREREPESATDPGFELSQAESEVVKALQEMHPGRVSVGRYGYPLRVDRVDFHKDIQLTEKELHYVKQLTNLTKLHFKYGQITDKELVHLKGLTNLASLHFSSPISQYQIKITDAGLEHLKGLTNLTSLYVGESQITDDGLEHLKGLTKLQELYLHTSLTTDEELQSQITDEGLGHLKGLTNLTSLSIAKSPPILFDFGPAKERRRASLAKLSLDSSQITGVGMENLKGLTNLTTLYLAPPRS
jgi:Leucine-rich repeat (LRR) protein